MRDRLNAAILVVVLGGFGAAVVAFVLTGAPSRLLGAVLVLLGGVAILGARNISEAERKHVRLISLGTRQKGSIRPTTVVIWGVGVLILGVLFVFGV